MALGRDASTLPAAAARIEAIPTLTSVLVGTGRKRLAQLLKLAGAESFSEQLCGMWGKLLCSAATELKANWPSR